jgi:hypothetical protein
VNPASAGSYNYTLNCTTPLATSSQTVTLIVVQQPTVSLSPASVIQGSGATLTWNTYASVNPNPWTCTWSSNDGTFVAPVAASGSMPVTPTAPGAFNYTLTCPAPSVAVTVTLTVTAPQAPLIGVSPSSITQGQSSTLSWTIYQGDVCSASSSGTDTNVNDRFTGMKPASGVLVVTPNAVGSDTYTLTCTAPVTAQSATLTVTPQLAKIAITVTGNDLDGVGDVGTLQWTLSGGASGCQVSGVWPLHSVPQFSPFPVASSGSMPVTFTAVGTYTYNLSCSNPAAPAQTSVLIHDGGE